MRFETKLIRDGAMMGHKVWVCDYRQPDLNKKPIRHVKPTKVIIVSNEDLPKNKTVYYSKTHFRPLNDKGNRTSKVIKPVDNTGYRSYAGEEINVFDSEIQCKQYYGAQCDAIIHRLQERIETAIEGLHRQQQEVIANKKEALK